MKVNFKFKTIFLILFLGVLPLLSNAQEKDIPVDSSAVELRGFKQASIDKFQNQRAYNYDNNPEYEQNIFRRLWFNFIRKIREQIGEATLNITFEVLKYVLILGAFGLLLHFLMKSNKTKFFKKSEESTDFEGLIMESDNAEQNLSILIENAEKEGNYSDAVRYQFLNSLRLLNDKELINWRKSKTNNEYLKELKDEYLSNNLEELVQVFEHVVYGEFETDDVQYQRFKTSFQAFNSIMKEVKA